MALFVFFPAAAGAGVVAADFVVVVLNGLRGDWFFPAIEDERGERARDDGRGRGHWCSRGLFFVSDRLYVKEPIKRVGLHPFHHAGKKIEAFALILNERIFLTIAA